MAKKILTLNPWLSVTKLKHVATCDEQYFVKLRGSVADYEWWVNYKYPAAELTFSCLPEPFRVKPEDELKTQDELMNTKTAIGALDVKGNDDAAGEVLKLKEAVAQPEPKPEVENKVFDVVEQMPSFPGGQAALMDYLSNNVKYPVVAQENGVQGRVVVSFVVEKDGSITDVKVVKSVDPSLDKEAARVVKSMPRWIPGKQNGSAVRVKYNVPVSFRLQ